MQPQSKDPHTAALGQRGGQKRIEQLNATERSTLISLREVGKRSSHSEFTLADAA
jgi:hypothetical protein